MTFVSLHSVIEFLSSQQNNVITRNTTEIKTLEFSTVDLRLKHKSSYFKERICELFIKIKSLNLTFYQDASTYFLDGNSDRQALRVHLEINIKAFHKLNCLQILKTDFASAAI